MEEHRTILPNGLRVVQVPMPAVRSVSLAILVGVGSRFESARVAGVSHLIEHMLFKGTERRPRAAVISETIDSVGGILNASTDKEVTAYWAKVASEYLPLAVDLLADMLRNSLLRPGELTREKNVVLEELNMLMDDPQDWVHVLADEVLWPRQPMGWEIAGTRESVRGLRRRDLCCHLDSYYGANNAVVSVAGSTDVDETLDLIDRHLGDWRPVPLTEPVPASFREIAPRSRIEWKPTEQVNLCLAYPGVPRHHVHSWTLDVLATILGGGTSSRLFVQLRERQGLVYDVHMYTTHLRDTGSVVIYSATDGARMDRVLDAVLREIDRLQRRPVSDAELQKAKQYFRGRLWLGLEDTHAVAGWFGAQELLQDDVVSPEEAAELVDAVTAADLRCAAQTYLQPEHMRLAAVGPVSNLGPSARVAGA